jgi:6-pyruvoyltetrahydropterin/6-carboxytetrahydropterin synthase
VTTVTRAYRFSASHRLHIAGLTDDENAALYGKCNNPYGHGHDYVVEVTCSGEPDRVSGLIIPVAELDGFVQATVLRHFAFRNINRDIPEFAHVVPTTENIAIVIARTLNEHWRELGWPGVRLQRIHIQETGRNGFELLLSQLPQLQKRLESANQVYA